MRELILGEAGGGKTRALARLAKECPAPLILAPDSHGAARLAALSGKDAFTPYGAACEIIKRVTGLPPMCAAVEKSEKKSRFSSKKEYERALSLGAPVSLCGEEMKSFGEVEIANYLFESRVDYIYEAPYKLDTRTRERAQYRPDFYLPEYDVYIEYFAVGRDKTTPAYFGDGEEYLRSMEWKFELHKKNGTKLVDLYAYERAEGTLIKTLAARLKKEKVKLRKRRRGELYPKAPEPLPASEDGFETVISEAAAYLKEKKYDCPYTRIFADDIAFMSKSAIGLIDAAGLDLTYTAAREDLLEPTHVTRLDGKGREGAVHFLFSYTEAGELEEIKKVLDALPDGSRVFVEGRTKRAARSFCEAPFEARFDRENELVRIKYIPNGTLDICFFSGAGALGRECDVAVVLGTGYGEGDVTLFEMAASRAKKDVYIISKTGGESPAAKRFRESRGAKEKKGFACPKCGAPLRHAKGKYGEFIGCTRCGYKRNM